MAENKICPTEGCGTEVVPQVIDGTIIWDCPNCEWVLEITVNGTGI